MVNLDKLLSCFIISINKTLRSGECYLDHVAAVGFRPILLASVIVDVCGSSAAVAATPTISAITSSTTTSGFPANNATDNNTATFFSSTLYGDANHTETLTIDLGSKFYSLNAIALTSRTNGYGFPSDFKIQSSDNGSTWADVVDSEFQNFSNPGTQSLTIAFRSFVAARYLRVVATKLNPDNAGNFALQFTEVSVRQNFPLVGGSTVAGAQVATNAFDGSLSTYYSSSSHALAASPEWLGVDLGTATKINWLQLAPRTSGYGFPTAYKVQFSNDASTWTDIPRTTYAGVANPGGSAISIPFDRDVTARYFRLYASTLGADSAGTFSLQLSEMSASNIVPLVGQAISSSAASSALGGWPLSALTDNDIDTAWSSVSHGGTQVATESFTLSYSASVVYTKFAITPRENGLAFPVDFKLQSSPDGTTYTDIPGQSYIAYPNPGSRRQVFTFDPVVAKALRLVATKLGSDGTNYYLQMAEASGYTADTLADTWSATDNLGRNVATVGQAPLARSKYVSMFYFLWHGNYGYPITDVTQVLTNNPGALTTINTNPPWGTGFHFWGKPQLNYYQSTDTFVLRNHAQILSDAGVDTVIFDISNFDSSDLAGSFFKTQWTALLNTWSSVRASGGKTPQVIFLCPFGTGTNVSACVHQLYTDLYGANVHPELWFQGYGKPILMADPSVITNSTEFNFFTFRKTISDYQSGPSAAGQWGWLENYPQHSFYYPTTATVEQVTVGVAQNSVPNGSGGWRLGAMSERNASGQLPARGRSFHNGANLLSTDPLDINYKSEFGFNFAEQWGRGLDLDPAFMFVTGWNEWIAGRFSSFNGVNQINLFPDGFDQQFSRDIEPMTGGHKDNYYLQFVDYNRRFKGVRQMSPVGPPKAISIDGSFADWVDVKAEYFDDVGDTAPRSNANWDASATLVDNTGRNDIQIMKVARDAVNIYFYIKTAANITPYTNSNWMRLFIRTAGSAANNWEGYNFIVNRNGVTSTTTKLETSTGGWNWGSATTISYRASGREMELAIPRSALGLASTSAPLRFDFKWADNITDGQDSMEFYIHGDAAPNARFRNRFDEFPVQ